jgi:hypothetical protein
MELNTLNEIDRKELIKLLYSKKISDEDIYKLVEINVDIYINILKIVYSKNNLDFEVDKSFITNKLNDFLFTYILNKSQNGGNSKTRNNAVRNSKTSNSKTSNSKTRNSKTRNNVSIKPESFKLNKINIPQSKNNFKLNKLINIVNRILMFILSLSALFAMFSMNADKYCNPEIASSLALRSSTIPEQYRGIFKKRFMEAHNKLNIDKCTQSKLNIFSQLKLTMPQFFYPEFNNLPIYLFQAANVSEDIIYQSLRNGTVLCEKEILGKGINPTYNFMAEHLKWPFPNQFKPNAITNQDTQSDNKFYIDPTKISNNPIPITDKYNPALVKTENLNYLFKWILSLDWLSLSKEGVKAHRTYKKMKNFPTFVLSTSLNQCKIKKAGELILISQGELIPIELIQWINFIDSITQIYNPNSWAFFKELLSFIIPLYLDLIYIFTRDKFKIK